MRKLELDASSLPDLTLIDNAWNFMKKKLQKKQSTRIRNLKEIQPDLWVHMHVDYFIKMEDFMPNVLQNAIKAMGHMTKY